MMYFEKLIPLTNRLEWNRALDNVPHAFAHTWESSNAMYLTHGNDTFLYTYTNDHVRIVCPICERKYCGYTDIVTPFGFPGFVGTGPCPEFKSHWKSFANRRHYVCGYIGINPILSDNSYFDIDEEFEYSKLYVLDLTLSIEQLFANLSDNRKRQLKYWKENQNNLILDKNILSDFFIKNYHDFIRKRNASKVYEFSIDTLLSILDLDKNLVIGIEEDGRVIAVSIFPFTPYMADFLFNVSLDEGRSYSASLIWYAVNHFKSMGVPYLNLGGGGETRMEFKSRFGPSVFPLKGLKQVYDEGTYGILCRQVAADPSDRTGFFPPYQKP